MLCVAKWGRHLLAISGALKPATRNRVLDSTVALMQDDTDAQDVGFEVQDEHASAHVSLRNKHQSTAPCTHENGTCHKCQAPAELHPSVLHAKPGKELIQPSCSSDGALQTSASTHCFASGSEEPSYGLGDSQAAEAANARDIPATGQSDIALAPPMAQASPGLAAAVNSEHPAHPLIPQHQHLPGIRVTGASWFSLLSNALLMKADCHVLSTYVLRGVPLDVCCAELTRTLPPWKQANLSGFLHNFSSKASTAFRLFCSSEVSMLSPLPFPGASMVEGGGVSSGAEEDITEPITPGRTERGGSASSAHRAQGPEVIIVNLLSKPPLITA